MNQSLKTKSRNGRKGKDRSVARQADRQKQHYAPQLNEEANALMSEIMKEWEGLR